ncbi:hypothetical protein MJO28_009192, partial [Puccinia striiformis f. sp. tritici]
MLAKLHHPFLKISFQERKGKPKKRANIMAEQFIRINQLISYNPGEATDLTKLCPAPDLLINMILLLLLKSQTRLYPGWKLNKFAVIKVEVVHLHHPRPPSPEGQFCKGSSSNKEKKHHQSHSSPQQNGGNHHDNYNYDQFNQSQSLDNCHKKHLLWNHSHLSIQTSPLTISNSHTIKPILKLSFCPSIQDTSTELPTVERKIEDPRKKGTNGNIVLLPPLSPSKQEVDPLASLEPPF